MAFLVCGSNIMKQTSSLISKSSVTVIYSLKVSGRTTLAAKPPCGLFDKVTRPP
jgi:hypothetical protein